MKLDSDRRVVLIAIIATCQTACLLGATLLFSVKLRESIRETIHDQVLADNVQTAQQMTALICQLEVDDLRENLASWQRLQDSIQSIRLPNEGFVCLTDDTDGSLLCHPLITAPPSHLATTAESPPEDTAKPAMAKPAMAKPAMAKPAMAKPAMTKPAMAKPAMAKPAMAKPAMAKPAMAKPAMAKPAMAKPAMAKPAMAKPAMAKPAMAKPAMAKPAMAKPAMAKPAMAKPAMTKPAMAKPAMAKPAMAKPAMAKPAMTKPAMTNGESSSGENFSGSVVEYGGELQIIAAGRIPELGATVHVHQLAAGIEHNISQVMSPIYPLAIIATIGLVLSTTVLVLWVMRGYDNCVDRINSQLEQLVDKRTIALRKTRDAVVYGLAKLAESRDTDTGEHLDRIRLYVTIVGRHLGSYRPEFNGAYVENLGLASSLHDIGKVGIPDAVLLKPGGFTPRERAVMEKHATIGGACLSAIGSQLGEDDFLAMARDITFCHHEKWDGSGYPFGISGETIPLSARIVALADVYDALRSKRPYKDPMPHEKAKQIILEGCGRHFDPKIVDAFLACEADFIAVSEDYIARPTCETPEQVLV